MGKKQPNNTEQCATRNLCDITKFSELSEYVSWLALHTRAEFTQSLFSSNDINCF